MRTVPNEKPKDGVTRPYKIGIIGEAPGQNEDAYGRPFVGPSGRLLTGFLNKLGIPREACFIGNVCQVRPPGDDLKKLDWDGEEIQSGLEQLKEDLSSHDYILFILLGNAPLRAAGISEPVGKYRGTVFICNDLSSPFFGKKCVATYHPSFILRGNGSYLPVFESDLRRAVEESKTETLILTERRYELDLTADQIVERLESIQDNPVKIGFDIEGGVDRLRCYSVAPKNDEAFIVPFDLGDRDLWSLEDELKIWRATARLCADSRVPKVLQNSLYDCFVLAYKYRIFVANVQSDIMVRHAELYPEFEKNLGFQVSFYTTDPYHKSEIKSQSIRDFWTYCCKDSALTREIDDAQIEHLAQRPECSRRHYQFNMEMLRPILYMELRGIRYNMKGAKEKILKLEAEIADFQRKVDAVAGYPLNVKSTTQMKQFVYGELHLPVRTNRKTGRPSLDYENLLALAKQTGKQVLFDIIEIRERRTRVQMLNIRDDEDGRIRCTYNIVGTNTGRLTCSTSPTGSGYNLTTIPEDDQDLYLADEGCWMWKCDLDGADAWTVAAWSAALGDPTMLEDLKYGIKPAKVIAAAFQHGSSITSLPRPELKALVDKIDKKSELYFGSKCCSHGANYGAGKITVSATIFKESRGAINIPSRDCERLMQYYFLRYPGVKRWHSFVQQKLNSTGTIEAACGLVRKFNGPRGDHEVFKAALAFEPQANTCWFTNQAIIKLWKDPENRQPPEIRGGRKVILINEPLHQIHDAAMGQFPKAKTEFCVRKIREEYFNNTLKIANQEIKIPFDGAYGSTWGTLEAGVI